MVSVDRPAKLSHKLSSMFHSAVHNHHKTRGQYCVTQCTLFVFRVSFYSLELFNAVLSAEMYWLGPRKCLRVCVCVCVCVCAVSYTHLTLPTSSEV